MNENRNYVFGSVIAAVFMSFGLLAYGSLVTNNVAQVNNGPAVVADHSNVEPDSDENHEVAPTIEVTEATSNNDPSI